MFFVYHDITARYDQFMATQSLIQRSSRLTVSTSQTRELLILISAGVAAAALTTFLKLHLSLPGHAILKVVLPLSLGYAIAPRDYAGALMGGSDLRTIRFQRSFQRPGKRGSRTEETSRLCLRVSGRLAD